MKRLIVTADDFGRAAPINEAVEDAHRQGILTAASLMIGGAAADDAIERAWRLPTLAVGLHVTLVDGLPMLPPSQIPGLVETDGRFTRRLVGLGARIYLDRRVRRQAEAEMRAQFEAYRATGLPLGHVDSHHHYHLHPTVFDLLLALAVEYGAPAIRLPWERSWRSLPHLRRLLRMRAAIRKAGLLTNDRIFGMADSGAMNTARLSSLLATLPDGLTEIYCHPATRRWHDHPMPPRYRCRDEYLALIDPILAEQIRQTGIVLTSFVGEVKR